LNNLVWNIAEILEIKGNKGKVSREKHITDSTELLRFSLRTYPF
jgi:hypothetical protein